MTEKAGWYPDPGKQFGRRWWDGEAWSPWVSPSGQRMFTEPTSQRWPPPGPPRRGCVIWFSLVVVVAVLGVIPTSWAMQDFGQPMHGLSCSEEPWHTDPAGMRAWWFWWAALALLVAVGILAFRKKNGRERGMTIGAVLIALIVPPIGWAAGYMLSVMNCGL